MICSTCREAGQYNARELYEHAQDLHAACVDICCPCQHKTGDGSINPERT